MSDGHARYNLSGPPNAQGFSSGSSDAGSAAFVPNPASDITNPPPGSPAGTAQGNVMTNPVIYNVFWLPANQHYEPAATAATDTRFENLMNQYATDVGGNPYYNILTQYPGANGTPANAVTLGGSTIDTTAYPRAGSATDPLLESDINDAVNRAATSQGWVKDVNHLYAVYTANGIEECDGTAHNFCTPGTTAVMGNFCAYHQFTNPPHAFMPSTCSSRAPSPSPNGDQRADAVIEIFSHELFEAVTDPLGNAWQGPGGASAEISDLCNALNGTTNFEGANTYLNGHGYTSELQWSNAVHGCAIDLCGTTVCSPTVSVSLTGPATAVPSLQQASYTVKVSNSNNTAPAKDVVITRLPPSGMSPGGTLTLPDVAVHDSQQSTFQETVDSNNNLPDGTKLSMCVKVDFKNWVDTVQPSITKCVDTFVSNTAPVLTVPSTQTVRYHENLAPVNATATDANAGDLLTFTQSGLPADLTFTDNGDRSATVQGFANSLPATYPVTVNVADGHNPQVSGSFNVVITKQPTSLAYTGDTKVANGTQARLAAVLKEGTGTPISGRSLVLTLGIGSTAQACLATTNASGTGACFIPDVEQPLIGSTGDVPVSGSFSGDAYYLPSSFTGSVKLLLMTGRSYGLLGNTGLLGITTQIGPAPDTGQVKTSTASTTSPPCTATILAGGISAQNLCARVTTSVNPGSSLATASVSKASIGLPGVPAIAITTLSTSSKMTCAAWIPSMSVAQITIAGATINVNNVKPNTKISLGTGMTLTLNEQIRTTTTNPDTLVGTVIGAHLTVNTALLKADVAIASATADMHNC